MLEQTSYKDRRDILAREIQNGIIILLSAEYQTRSNDTEYSFRQNSQFKYMTGFPEPDSCLVMKIHEGHYTDTLFVRPKDPHAEMWSGKRLGEEKARELMSVDHSYPIHELGKRLPELLEGHQTIYLDLYNEKLMRKVLAGSKALEAKRKKKILRPSRLQHLPPLIGKMRLVKDTNEILFMKKAAKATEIAHRAAMAMAVPGKNEGDIDNLMEFLFRKNGASGSAYSSIVASGVNGLILHYVENSTHLNAGEMLLIDAGAEVNLYASDVTRTFPVDGVFTSAQRDIYSLVLESQKAAIQLARPGKTLEEIHTETCLVLIRGLIDLGILEGGPEEILKNGEFRRYYPHGTGHWLGLDVHDECPYRQENLNDIELAAGMVFTIEPGLYLPKNDPKVPTQYQGMAVRIEDDILITESGHENLTVSIPKEIKEIEEACKVDFKTFLD